MEDEITRIELELGKIMPVICCVIDLLKQENELNKRGRLITESIQLIERDNDSETKDAQT